MSKAKDYYTVKEFAEEYDVSTDRVYEWVRSGYIEPLPRVTPHSIWRIPKTELERLRGKASEVTQPIIPKAKEEHLYELRQLILDWIDTLNDVPTIWEMYGHPILKAEDIPELKPSNHFVLPELEKDIVLRAPPWDIILANHLFQCLEEHLPLANLWDDYSTWQSKFNDYRYGQCTSFLNNILNESKRWSGYFKLGKDYPAPIISNVAHTQVGLDINEYQFQVIHRQPTYLRAYVKGVPSLNFEILFAENPKKYIQAYKEMYERILNSELVSDLIHSFDELINIQNKIKEQLKDILIRREYYNTTCTLCPKY